VVYSASISEHQEHLRVVLGRLRSAGFKLNKEKIVLDASEIKYLGHYLSSRGIRVIPDRVEAIKQYPCPRNFRDVRRFLGMVSFYTRFIAEFSQQAAPLHRLKGKGIHFVWGEEQQASFESLKTALCEAPVLQVPDFKKKFVLVTDASDIAVSAVLNQRVNGQLAPVAFYSKFLGVAERRYSTYEKEFLAIVFGCERARSYLEHKQFELQCDNLALCWLFRNVKDVGRLGRWILRLARFKFKVHHTRGTDNVVADSLYRMFEGREVTDQEEGLLAMIQGLPLVYTSLEEHQKEDPLCKDLLEALKRKIRQRLSFGCITVCCVINRKVPKTDDRLPRRYCARCC